MVAASVIKPVLTAITIFLYVILLLRFFGLGVKLRLAMLKDGLELLLKKKKTLILCLLFVFLFYFTGQMVINRGTPSMLIVFNYEEAARGQNPNSTRFNESDILSERILTKVIERGNLGMSAERLSDFLTISTSLDEQELDVSTESNLKISTEYRINCSEAVSLYHTKPKTVLNLLADVYWEDFILNYAENDSLLDLSFEELDEMEYLDIKDYLNMQASKLRRYIRDYMNESGGFRIEDSEESFSSMTRKINNFIDIELERYEAFVLEKGLAKNESSYQSRMEYANHLLTVERDKDMASHDVRIDTIDMYNVFMSRFVLIPTYDTDEEFYMSRTKIGIDYFADEAKEYLGSATALVEAIAHNDYASEQIRLSRSSDNIYKEAEQRIDALKTELIELSKQCRELCDAYVKEKRNGYVKMRFTMSSTMDVAKESVMFLALFFVALAGNTVLGAFRQEQDIPMSRKSAIMQADNAMKQIRQKEVTDERT